MMNKATENYKIHCFALGSWIKEQEEKQKKNKNKQVEDEEREVLYVIQDF